MLAHDRLRISTQSSIGLPPNTVPTALLHIGSGAEAAGSAQIKLSPGTLTSVPEDGTIEYSSSNLYMTRGTSRRQVGTRPFCNQITVSHDPTVGDFTTIQDAVSWFNASATGNTAILLDAGVHEVGATVVINNSIYSTEIFGLGSTVSHVVATSSLNNAPMFDVRSTCDFSKLLLDGTAATGTCSALSFGTVAGLYIEITDIVISHFGTAVVDTIGTDMFIFNFDILSCTLGIQQNYSTDLGRSTLLDVEVGNFEGCTTCVDLLKGTLCNVLLMHLVFINSASPPATCIKYTGGTGNFVLSSTFNVFNNTYNGVGTFRSGFDFTRTDARDADIAFVGNSGVEDSFAHAKINVADGTTTTTTTAAGTYYKVNGLNSKVAVIFNNAATAGSYTISVNGETTASILWNDTVSTIKTRLQALSSVGTVTVLSPVANKEFSIEFTTAGKGWVDMPVSYNIGSLTGPTSVSVENSYYTKKWSITNNRLTYQSRLKRDVRCWVSAAVSASVNNVSITMGVKRNGTGNIISPFTCRTATSGQVYPLSFVAYFESVVKDDYFELWITSSQSNGVITLSDLTLYIEAK